MLLFLIQLKAARRFETPLGIDLWDRYKKGIGEDRWTNGIPREFLKTNISYRSAHWYARKLLPKFSKRSSMTGLHVSVSSARTQNNRWTCINVCPSLVNSAICSRLKSRIMKAHYKLDYKLETSIYIPWISWCHKVNDWKLPVMTRRLGCGCWCTDRF